MCFLHRRCHFLFSSLSFYSLASLLCCPMWLDFLTRTHNKNWIYPWQNGNSYIHSHLARNVWEPVSQKKKKISRHHGVNLEFMWIHWKMLWSLATRSHSMELNLIWIYQEHFFLLFLSLSLSPFFVLSVFLSLARYVFLSLCVRVCFCCLSCVFFDRM